MRTSARCLLASVAEAADTCGGVVFADLDGDGNRREALARDGTPDVPNQASPTST